MVLKGFSFNKALGLKKIINEFFKICGEQLGLVLAKLFNNYIVIKYYLKPFKDFIIIVF